MCILVFARFFKAFEANCTFWQIAFIFWQVISRIFTQLLFCGFWAHHITINILLLSYHPKGCGLQDPKYQSKNDAWRPWLRRVSWPRIKEIWTQDRSHPHLILALVLLEVPEDKEENCSLVTLQTWKCRASCPLWEFPAPEKVTKINLKLFFIIG